MEPALLQQIEQHRGDQDESIIEMLTPPRLSQNLRCILRYVPRLARRPYSDSFLWLETGEKSVEKTTALDTSAMQRLGQHLLFRARLKRKRRAATWLPRHQGRGTHKNANSARFARKLRGPGTKVSRDKGKEIISGPLPLCPLTPRNNSKE